MSYHEHVPEDNHESNFTTVSSIASLELLGGLWVVLGDVGVTALGVLVVRFLDLLLRGVPRHPQDPVVVFRPEPRSVEQLSALEAPGSCKSENVML